MRKILISEKGFAASDALMALLIIVLFSSIIITFSYNIYLVNANITRTSKANGYAVAILEEIDKMYYDEIVDNTDETGQTDIITKLEELFTEDTKVSIKYVNDEGTNLPTPYKIEIGIQSYTDFMQDEQEYLDLVKRITVNVKYNVGNKEKQILINRVKAREKLIVPNSPDNTLRDINEGYYIVPIKYENNNWKVTTMDDTTWYNYDNGYWATVLVSINDKEEGEIVDLTNEKNNTYVWIPRYAYNGTDVKFLYHISKQYVDDTANYPRLEDIDETQYTISFQEKGKWITIQDIEDDTIQESYYTNLDASKYKRKN